MKIAILGYGSQGQAAYEYWRDGNEVTICDNAEDVALPEGVHAKLGGGYLHGLEQYDLLVRSPGVHPADIAAANNPDILQKVTTVTNEFMRVCPTRNIIGVTGTKGKGTTSTLIAKMLEADGKRVHLGGNIGIPPLAMLKDGIRPEDWVVLELANFQLIDLQTAPHIAVCLMVVPEHLNWHADTEEYFRSKAELFRHQTSDDFAIYNAQNENSVRIASTSKGWKVPYMAFPGAYVEGSKIIVDNQTVCDVSEIKLLGAHNWQNVCAAATAFWKVSQNVNAIRQAVTGFGGLPHHLEFIREVAGVQYYDDSFGTTPETAIVALQAFEQPKVIILGGSDKGASYDELAQVVAKSRVRAVVLIGDQGERIQAALTQAGFHNFVAGGSTMAAIVATARDAAQPGDVVLLSPACASFDMFANYKDRGEQFQAAVQVLPA